MEGAEQEPDALYGRGPRLHTAPSVMTAWSSSEPAMLSALSTRSFRARPNANRWFAGCEPVLSAGPAETLDSALAAIASTTRPSRRVAARCILRTRAVSLAVYRTLTAPPARHPHPPLSRLRARGN